MSRLNELLIEYSESHQHSHNIIIHWVCVPLIVWSLLALLWLIPVPGFFNSLPVQLNWALVILALAMVYYLLLSWALAAGLLIIFILMLLPFPWIDATGISLLKLSLAIFVVAWTGQFIGHILEGRRPSFFKDLQFLLIGPLWLLARLYGKLGIPY